MSKFKVLEYNQSVMARLGIHSHHLHANTNEFLKSFVTWYYLCTIIFFIFGSIMFICINWPAYEVISEPCLIAVGCMQVLGMFIGVGLKMKKVKKLHLRLQEIVDNSTYFNFLYKFCIFSNFSFLNIKLFFFIVPEHDEQIYYIYFNTEQKCRQFTKNFVKFIFINQQMYLAAMIFSIYSMIVGNFDTSTWILPFKCWVPFNTESVYGYYLHWFIQFSMGMAYSSSQVTITAYFVCCCYYIVAICDHYKFVMQTIKTETDKNLDEKNPLLYQKRNCEIKKKLLEAIDIHVKAYE